MTDNTRKLIFKTAIRVVPCADKIYLMRDLARDSGKGLQVQYATIVDDEIVWTNCREGVDFADIEPFTSIAA